MSIGFLGGDGHLLLSPASRGAPDVLRPVLEEWLGSPTRVLVASQQFADRGAVAALSHPETDRASGARVFVESDYLTEASPLADIWAEGGRREDHRQCLAALSRASIPVRADQVGGALQHANLVVRAGEEGPTGALLSSANIAPGSVDRHLNWTVLVNRPDAGTAVESLFQRLWDGDFSQARLDTWVGPPDGAVRLVAGRQGESVEEACRSIEQATRRVRFAYFAMSTGARVVDALRAAADRGVDVAGIVDGDQGGQPWDAVAELRQAGVDARYYPGGLTGGVGRMHHKMLVTDRSVAHLSTANASLAAQRSLEMSITIAEEPAAKAVDAEIVRLGQGSSTTPLATS